MRNAAVLLVLAFVSLGAAACKDDASDAAASAPPGSPSATSPVPSASASARPKATADQVIMIDPQGKKYTRKQTVQMAAGMAAAFKKSGLRSDFCATSYTQGVKDGGRFPAGRLAFMEACQEGARQAG